MNSPHPPKRPFLQVLFQCCRVYLRIYRDPEQPYYQGRCPRCLRTVRFRVGPEGTPARAFEVH
ncbi:MAG: hypothetical protein OEW39_15665 [Deltaproteobacteria bacterium]|nr:hypothetical protein [Deltaproteobacteria bacterium]